MAKLRPWPAYNLSGNRPAAVRYTLKANESFKAGDLVAIDTNEDVLEVSGADPTPILGVAAEDAQNVVESGYVMVYVATSDVVFAMQGDNAPTADDVNQSYGVVEDSDGIYTVDGTETTNTRVYVVGVDTNRELYFVKFLDAHRVINA